MVPLLMAGARILAPMAARALPAMARTMGPELVGNVVGNMLNGAAQPQQQQQQQSPLTQLGGILYD